MSRVVEYLRLVRFSHTVFALPFALAAVALASPDGPPPPPVWGWILVCLVSARTAAMAYNRLVDRDVDARNPRTRERHLPAGRLRAAEVVVLVAACSLVFLFAASRLNRWAALAAPFVLAFLLFYSHTKRFTALCHVVLGAGLALAPLGAWVAVRGLPGREATPVFWLAAAVCAWVAGFDVLYALQDERFDREHGLRSLPARLGTRRALLAARWLHAATALLLAGVGLTGGLGAVFWVGWGLAVALLFYEHTLVRPGDLSRLGTAFFTVNGWLGVLLGAAIVIEVWW